MFVDKCVFSQGALAEICTGSVKNLVRYGAMHQLGNYAIHDVHMVAYLMTGIPINNDNVHIRDGRPAPRGGGGSPPRPALWGGGGSPPRPAP